MRNRAAGNCSAHQRRAWPSPSLLLAGMALFIALGGSAMAATGLIHAGEIAPGAVTAKAIRPGAIEPKSLSTTTRALMVGAGGARGETGPAGTAGSNGANGPNGANGINGIDGAKGTNGTNGINGTNGTNGINGTIAPLSATQGLTALPTGIPSTTVVSLSVPAGNYVVLAKTELSHTGAGDTVECLLKSGTTTVDQVAMKTLPALPQSRPRCKR